MSSPCLLNHSAYFSIVSSWSEVRGTLVSDLRITIVYLCAAAKAWSVLSILYFAFGLFLALGRVEMPVLVFLLAMFFTIVGITNIACAKGLAQLLEKGRVLSLWTSVTALLLYSVFLYPILPEGDVRVVAASEIRGSILYELVLLAVLINQRIKAIF